MKRELTNAIRILVSLSVILSVTGCATQSGHEKAVNDANDRYRAARSNLMSTMAQQQFNAGDLDQAFKTLTDAIRVDSENPRLYLLMGRITLERGQLERSYQLFSSAIEFDSKMAEPYYYRGIVLQRWQRFDAALVEYQQAYDLRRDNVSYLLAIAEMYVLTDRRDEALRLLESKVDYFDQNAGIRIAVAQLYNLQGNSQKALDYYRQAAILQPDDPQVQEELAMALFTAGEMQESIRLLTLVMREADNKGRRDLPHMLGKAYIKLGRHTDAKTIFLDLTKSDPSDVVAWQRLGEVSWALQDGYGALRAANRAMALAPQNPDGFILAGMVYEQRGQFDRAIQVFDQAGRVAPNAALPMILRGLALERAGRTAAAEESYSEALKREPGDERARKLLDNVRAAGKSS